MLALGLYEVKVCDGCGFHETVRSDLTNVIMPELTYCSVCAGGDAYLRILQEQDEQWSKQNEQAPPKAQRPADGRRVGMRHLTPAEAEAERQRRQRKGGEPRGNQA